MITATGDNGIDLYFGNKLVLQHNHMWSSASSNIDFTSGNCIVAAKVTNTGGPGYFIASTSHGHLSGSQVRCSERAEEEGWWREDFSHWHWPQSVEHLPNDGSFAGQIASGIREHAKWVQPAFDNTVPTFYCRWSFCGDCSMLEDIYERASTLDLLLKYM